jgi:parvulin-like peptidyl-prolyl isomerase
MVTITPSILLWSLAVACPLPGSLERKGKVLATVNGQPITQGMVQGLLTWKGYPQLEERSAVQAEVQEALITQEVLYQEALQEQLFLQEAVQLSLGFAEREELVRALIAQEVGELYLPGPPRSESVRSYIEALKEEASFEEESKPDPIKKYHIPGADFAALAQANSQDSAWDAQTAHWVMLKRLMPEIAEPLSTAAIGSLLGPLKGPRGFYLVLLEDRRELVPLEEAEEDVKQKLRPELMNFYTAKLKAAATIRILSP